MVLLSAAYGQYVYKSYVGDEEYNVNDNNNVNYFGDDEDVHQPYTAAALGLPQNGLKA